MSADRSHPPAADPERSGFAGADHILCLSLRAAPEIGVVARVIQHLARLQLMPLSWHGTDAGAHLLLDLRVAGLAEREGELLGEALRRIVGVEEVLMARVLRRTAA